MSQHSIDTQADQNSYAHGLYDPTLEKSNCGVGFITRKDGSQSFDVLKKGHEALCAVPHRGGMSSLGVGDGAGVSVDLSQKFFRKVTGIADLKLGEFGVGNFFLPDNRKEHGRAEALIESTLKEHGLDVITKRDVPVDESAVRPASAAAQFLIRQWVFARPAAIKDIKAFDAVIHEALLSIEAVAYTDAALDGLYPISFSSRTQVYKGRLNSNEILPYFKDLCDEDHAIHTMFFHTRFSTNTDPHPTMAQPFRLMAHNGELNTDKKNRLSEAAIARTKNRAIIAPRGQSDSCRLDQTLERRLIEDDLDLVTAVVAMMPPAWENDANLSPQVRDMLEYFSLYEEKNDGPAALIFSNGEIVGARLDRLGLRPLRTVETADYLCCMSEAGQIDFPPETVIHRGRIEAGGMLYYDHNEKRSYTTLDALEKLAKKEDYATLLKKARVNLDELPLDDYAKPLAEYVGEGGFNTVQAYVAYSHNQESFKFMMDPMIQTGSEKISAMGYGHAINTLSDTEGGASKYFSQRFAQVTNPPLDSLREADGMTLRVALGAKPNFGHPDSQQIIIRSPILSREEMRKLMFQKAVPIKRFGMFFEPDYHNEAQNELAMTAAIEELCDEIEHYARTKGGIAVLSDRALEPSKAALPLLLAVAAVNQRLISEGLRFELTFICETGQVASPHHIATALGFGASAIFPVAVRMRAEEKFGQDAPKHLKNFIKAAEKSLMKTMGKVGLCTAESYIGGEFFEPNFLDTNDGKLKDYFPNVRSLVGGVGYRNLATAAAQWHQRANAVSTEADIPLLGLFKERAEGAGHSYGVTAVRGFVDMTEEPITFAKDDKEGEDTDSLRLLPLAQLEDAFGIDDSAYKSSSFDLRTPKQVDDFKITPGYRNFSKMMEQERISRPAALRDVLAFPADVNFAHTAHEFAFQLNHQSLIGNNSFVVRGLEKKVLGEGHYRLTLTGSLAKEEGRAEALRAALKARFQEEIFHEVTDGANLELEASGRARAYFEALVAGPKSLKLKDIQPAHQIAQAMASGAMSHGALNAPSHEAVAHGTNIAGALSNSGEGGEHVSRYGTVRASRIKQFASGRFGVWAGYMADPMLQELEIKIAQGAKPGEGGQLPAKKVTVEIAAARGGTPGVELVSPPPHHDTYSIEDLAQLIHDCKAARVRVIVKLVSSEGIGTIAVGVAKAGADVINVAGNTGGTGAAAVTSLKNTGRAAEIGLAEVHQALVANGIRQKVVLRGSGAHQTASDVVKSALLGADSFEFGTTALMMLKCVMAKNCNIKCPAGLTTNAEVFEGDPRALAQYLMNISHEVREILAELGLKSLKEARGRSDLLHLINHPRAVGQMDLRRMLAYFPEHPVKDPIYLEADFTTDDSFLAAVQKTLVDEGKVQCVIDHPHKLNNRDKTVGGQLAIDIERMLNHTLSDDKLAQMKAAKTDARGRTYFDRDAIIINTFGSAGQSFGAFCNDGMNLRHIGTCNDGVGKSQCGGTIAVISPGGGSEEANGNVLIGNFALFGASGGSLFVEGQAGDRFAVRNSGALAVVEGVGDFACEYMTNGAVVNLGSFGKGFANGMSGGFAYQYDPYQMLASNHSADSVVLASIGDDTEEAMFHRHAVKMILQAHVEETGSAKAQWILAHWESEHRNFAYAMPRALLLYQDSDAILAANSRKELLDELGQALAAYQVRKFKLAYRNGEKLFGGAAPRPEDHDTEKMFKLLNNYTVLHMAQELAVSRLRDVSAVSDPNVQPAVRKLLLTEDFSLMQKLLRYAREAIDSYSDKDLAVLMSDKRLRDYKAALDQRNVLSMDSAGTYGWIIHLDRRNRKLIGSMPSFEELFARLAMPDVSAAAKSQN